MEDSSATMEEESAEGAAGKEGAASSAPTVGEAAGWLASVRPKAVLTLLLHESDFALISERAFKGFQKTVKGYASEHVRNRLAQEAVKDSKFADRLRTLAAETPSRPNSGEPEKSFPTPPLLGAGGQSQDFQAKLRTEREGWRREREELRKKLALAETARIEVEHTQKLLTKERDEAKSQAERQGQRLARQERQIARLRSEQNGLMAALRQDKVSPPRSSVQHSGGLPQQFQSDSLWLEAARHLRDKGKHEQALILAEDVLRADPNEQHALDLASQALEGKKQARQATVYVRRLFAVQMARQEIGEAGESLLRLLTLLPAPEAAEREAKAWLAALRGANGTARDAARLLLVRLRGFAPHAHVWLTGYLETHAPSALALTLMPPPGLLGPDDPLPLNLGFVGPSPTARQLCRAVETGKAVLVDAARAALGQLEQASPDDYRRARTALDQAAGDDPSLLLPLLREPKNAAVVDGSNVAWYDQESLVAGKPRLRPVLAMRRTLRLRGFFPVVIYGDANLPHLIDDAAALRALISRAEILLTDSGVTADEVSLREAKRLGAALVTNDYMGDWDPRGEVPKIRYTISMTGEALLLE